MRWLGIDVKVAMAARGGLLAGMMLSSPPHPAAAANGHQAVMPASGSSSGWRDRLVIGDYASRANVVSFRRGG